MIIPAKSLNSSASLNDVIFNPNSHVSGLNPLNMNVMPFDRLRDGSAKAQGKMASCELLVVFDARVSDLPTLLRAVVEGAGSYVLSEDEDAITVITQLLAETGAKRLALVAHGEPGVVHIGATPLDMVQLERRAGLFQEWGIEEIALYSCQVANDDIGKRMIHALAQLTGAAVAASANQVGSNVLGGSWDLEATTAIFSGSQFFVPSVLQYYQATLIPFSPSDPTLTNGGLTIKIRQDNGAIASAVFNGIDYFNSGTPVSNWGLEVNGSFVTNSTSGGGASSSVSSLSSDTVQVVSTHNGVRATRIYKIFGETLQVSVKVENLNLSSTTIKIFDTFDPDQIQFEQNLDVFSQTISGGVIKAAQASQGAAQTVVLASVDPSIAISAGNPFLISDPGTLNLVLNSPGDPNGAFQDLGIHAATSRTLGTSQSFNYSYVMAFGSTSSSANTNLVNSFLAPSISAPPSFTVVEDVAGSLTFTGTPFTDLDSGNLVITLSIADGVITGTAIAGITIGGTATARTFSGTKAALNSYFTSAGNITYTSALNNNSPRSLTVNVSDGSLTASATSAINITPVNDAPILNTSATPVLTVISEDTLNSPGNTVAEIVVDGSITDVDIVGVAPEAIAVSAVDNTNGIWQYQLSGGSWTAFDFTGSNAGKALLLDSTTKIRFVPNANYNGTATFTFRAWDQTLGASGSYFTFATVAGTLDSTFGTGGIAFADFNNGLDIANTIVVQADGKTIVAGYTHPSSGYRDSAFARFNSNGTLDTTFGIGGKVVIDLGSTGNDAIGKIHALNSGGILATGVAYQSSGYFSISLAKLTATGTLDTSFGNGGKVVTDLGTNSSIVDSVILANGKIVGIGTLQNAGFAVVQYNSDGTLDTSFDTDGVATTTLGSAFDVARSVTTTPDGKILVAGFYYGPSGQTLGLARFNSNGSLDTTFDGDGKLTVGDRIFVDDDLSNVRVVGLADGKFLVGATVAYPNGFHATVYRFNQDGTLDSTFANAGKQNVDINSIQYLYLNDLQVTGDGKIVLGVSANQGTPSSPNFDFAAVRLNPNGTIDTGFGTNGITIVPISTLSTNAADFARAIQVNGAGDILIGGYSNQTPVFNGDRQFALVKLKGDTFESTVSTQSDTASITITPVNDPPILDLNGAAIGIDFSASFTEDGGTVSIVSPTLSLTDIDSPTISSATITITNLQESATESLSLPSTFGYMAAIYSTSTGTFQLLGTATLAQYQQVLRTISYNNTSQNPNPTPRLISFVVNDGTSNSAITTSTISINPVNDPPFLDLNGAAPGTNFNSTFTEDGGAISIVSPTLTLTDADSTQVNIATARITNLQDVGSEFLTANTAGTSIVTTYYASVGILELRGFDTVANYQQVLRSVTYNNTSQNPTFGDRNIEFGVNDSMANSNIPTAIVSVISVNDAPIVANAIATQNGTEDTAVNFTIPANTFSDVDNASLTLTATLGDGNALPTWLIFAPATGTFSGTPPQNFNGTISLKVTATDSGSLSASSTFDLVIAAVNDVPVAVASSNAVLEDATITGSVSAIDADAGAVLTYALVNAAPTGLTFNNDGTYTFDASSYDSLAAGQTQVLAVAFTATDGIDTSVSENLTITITGTNDVPVAVASSNAVLEDANITGSVSATDADTGAVLTYTLVNAAPTGLTFNNDGTYSFDASSYDSLAAGQTQVLNIAFTATDGIDTSTAEDLTITITGTNDTPVATSAVNAVNEDAVITGSVSATDADAGAVLTYALVNAAPTGLTFNSDGTYTFDASSYDSLATGQTQVLNIAFTATDGIATSTAENLTITITGTNDVPVAVASSNAVLEDATIIGSVSATDADAGAVLTYALVNAAPTGLTFNNDGTYSFDASSYDSLAAGQTQVLNIAFTATDGIDTSTAEDLTITITGTNDAAIITGTSTGSVLESGTSTSGTPTATGDLNATDVDNTSDTWTAVATATTSANGYGSYTLTANGVWAYTLNNTNNTVQALNTGTTLTDTFTVQTIDGTTQTISITINGTNDAPIISSVSDDTGASGSDRITKDNTLTLTGIAEANSTIQLFNGLTALGTATTNSLGAWNLTTATLSDGTYNLTAQATDTAGNISASSAPVTVTVDTTAAAPTLSLAIDSGSSPIDKITNTGIVIVNGLEPGASWEYSTNNGTTWLSSSGNSFTLTGDGAKSAVVRQTDLAGNTSSSSVPFTFTLDTVAPTKTATVTTMTLDSGTSATDFLTNNGSAGRIYNGTLSAALSVGESLQVSVDGGTTWANASVSSTTWSFTDNTAKSSNWTIQTRVVDTAGNGTIRSKAVTLDQQISAASAVTLDLAAASDTGVSATDNLTTVVKPTFAVTFDSTKAQVGDTLEIRQGATVLGSITLTATQVSAGTANITLATNLTNGVNTLTALHRDVAGNSVTGSSPLAVTLDQQISAASAVTLDLLASSDSGSSTTDNLTNLALSTFAIAFDTTKAQAGDIVEVRKGTAVLGSTTLTAAQVSAGIANVTLTTALANGANALSAVHRDAAGNSVIGSSTLAVTLDTAAPAAATVNGYTATSVVGTTEPNATVLLSTSASAPTTFAATATAAANDNYTINTSTLAGSSAGTTYYLYAQDVAGNLSTVNSSQKVIVGTAGADSLINVGSTAGDLLVGGLGTDTAQYAVASNAIALTGQITGTNITSGSINIRTANIDVLTGLETLQFAGSGYSGVGTGANQLRSGVQTVLGNNSIAAFTGAYDATTGIFTLGTSPSNNATLVAFDSNSSGSTNYETFLLLDKTSIVGGLSVSGGTVTLGL
jgi:uncharacterized delta-60 repeat protein